MSQKSVNRYSQMGMIQSVFLILHIWDEVQASRCRWSEPFTGRNHLGHSFFWCILLYSFYCPVLAIGWVVLLSVWCVTLSKRRIYLGFINASFMLGEREPRGGVNSRLCLFHDWINVCYFLFTENSTCLALVVPKWMRMNSADSSVNCTLKCLNDFYKFPPTWARSKALRRCYLIKTEIHLAPSHTQLCLRLKLVL